jgi:xanthine/uracil permease
MFIFLGMFGKFGAALTIIPDPIIGGMSVVGFGKKPVNN